MITTEQLAGALQRLSVSDRELLDLSLRRRVPDDALASLLGCGVEEVARRRADAIERLSDELAIRRGEDLGAMLTALLEPATWEAARADEAARPDGRPRAAPAATTPDDGHAPAADTPQAERAQPEEGAPEPPPAELAADREADLEAADEPAPRRLSRSPLVWAAAGAGGAVALLAAGYGAAQLGDGDSGTGESDRSGARRFAPEKGGPVAAPFPSDPDTNAPYLTATVPRAATLYNRPGGRRLVRLSARTEWGSPRVLSVVRRRGPWLGVLAPELKNGVVGWLPQRVARLGGVRWSVRADLSRRRLTVRRGGRRVRSMRIAVGGGRHPTPTGRFAVTDKLRVTDKGSPYGCCVLALTGHQLRLPPDWPGGDRLAVHATRDTPTIGKAVTLGCMRVTTEQARWLIGTVPIGAPVVIRG